MLSRGSTKTLAAPLAHYDSDELHRITAPTPLLWGGTEGVVGRDVQDMLTERFRGAQSLSYPWSGTPRGGVDPSRFSGDVAAFIERTRQPRP